MARSLHARALAAALGAVVALAVAGRVVAAAGPYAGSKPNIIVFFADDLGFGDLQVYGHPTTVTPNIDELAAGGMRFTQWYSAFHVCSPSRGAMLTGRLPIRTGTAGATWTGGVFRETSVGGLPTNETTFADAAKTAGYATAAVGKWHVGQQKQYLPPSRGFDSYLGIPYSDDMGKSAWSMQGGFPPLPLIQDYTAIEQPVNLNTLTDRYVAHAKAFIDNATAAKKPFLLYQAWNHVHTPDFASPAFCNITKRGRFGDALAEMDAGIGEIMAAVKAAGAEEDTIVFFTSDNGAWLIRHLAGGSNGLLYGGKQTTWEGGIREPGIVYWPGKIAPGITSEVATTYDIYPTLHALMGVPLPTDRVIDGRDMSSLLFTPGAKSPHDCLFFYKGTPGLGCPKGHDDCPGLWAARCGAYKMHWVTSEWSSANDGVFHDPPLIYQIENDPSEAWPLAQGGEYDAARAMIEAAAAAHKATLTDVPNQMALGTNNSLAVCCNGPAGYAGDSLAIALRAVLPDGREASAACTCNPENYDVFVCSPVGPHADAEVEAAQAEDGGEYRYLSVLDTAQTRDA